MTANGGDLAGERRDFELPLSEPLSTAAGTIESRAGSLVCVGRSDDGDGPADGGPVGVGEATPLPGWTEPLGECRAAIDRALERLETGGPDAALAATEGSPAARHGVSLALLDREARLAGEPLYRHLREDGGEAVTSVPVNGTVGDGRIMETVGAALEAVRAGFGTLKIKVGARETAIDAGRLEAIRSEVSGDVELRVDANGAWSPSEARLAIGAFQDAETIDLEYVEQPLAPGNLSGHADLRARAEIALDESLAERSIGDVVEAGAADVVVLKPMALGGVDRAWTAAKRAREAGIDPVVTTTIDGVVARTAAVHLAAGLGIDRACGLATADRLETDLAPDPAGVSGGRISVPRAAGNGVSVAWTGE
jgi:o-succinylbenzoate synthase